MSPQNRYRSVSHHEIATRWLVCPAGLPLIRRRCLRCPSAHYRTPGKFRVNANHKLLDVWLLALCTGCGETVKLTVLERVPVRTIDPEDLHRFHANDIDLASELLDDPGLRRRNGIALDWDGAWTLRRTAPEDAEVVEVSVRFGRCRPGWRCRARRCGRTSPTAASRRNAA
jgi:hypothetical protein